MNGVIGSCGNRVIDWRIARRAGDVSVTRSLDSVHGLDCEAVKAMKQWEFKPGTKDGTPVAARVSVRITFELK